MISTRRRTLGAMTLLCSVIASTSTWTHHSHGNYADTFTDIEGVVREVHLVNPHSWIYLDVKGPNGQPQKWSLEAASLIQLERIGVNRDYIKPGDTIKARCHPLRDGSRGCLLGFVKARDGSIKDWDASNIPLPTDF
jgi:Family of unknown function (DUF6152)